MGSSCDTKSAIRGHRQGQPNAPGLGGELLEPFAKSSIQRLAPSASDGSGPFDQILVRAQCNVLHSTLMYTIFVQTPTIFGLPIA